MCAKRVLEPRDGEFERSRNMSLARLSLIALAACLPTLTACSAPPGEDAGEGANEISGNQMSAAASARWNAYVARVTQGVTLQSGCRPTRVSPVKGASYKGTIVLFHGFTACPQQFFEVAKPLSAAGFEVLMPLLPGEGRVTVARNGKMHDDLSDMPTPATRTRYLDLADEMTEIARMAGGTKVVGGLSVGGMVATAALERGAGVWARGEVFAPFFGAPGLQGWITQGVAPLLPSYVQAWEGCDAARQNPNHARSGYCEFQLQHLEAAIQLGKEVVSGAGAIAVPVQLAGVEADRAADDGLMHDVVDRAANMNACFYPKGTPHAFVARFDHPELDMKWIPLLNQQITAYATRGAPFATEGTSSEYGFPRCVIAR